MFKVDLKKGTGLQYFFKSTGFQMFGVDEWGNVKLKIRNITEDNSRGNRKMIILIMGVEAMRVPSK